MIADCYLLMSLKNAVAKRLKLTPHPEGGHFVETHRDVYENVSLIYFLLEKGERSHWHRLQKNEILHFYDGDPMSVLVSADGASVEQISLGRSLDDNQFYHWVVPSCTWFSMRSTGDWSLIGCTVAPAFCYDDFELAPENWSPGAGHPIEESGS